MWRKFRGLTRGQEGCQGEEFQERTVWNAASLVVCASLGCTSGLGLIGHRPWALDPQNPLGHFLGPSLAPKESSWVYMSEKIL